MPFAVYEDNSRIGDVSWEEDCFETQREAEVAAFLYVFPFEYFEGKEYAPEQEVGEEFNYGTADRPRWMRIEEILS